MSEPAHVLTLLGRSGCHLCEDMRAALDDRAARFAFTLRELDITGNPALEARYGWEIPVLLTEEGREICRYYLDDAALLTWLSETGNFL